MSSLKTTNTIALNAYESTFSKAQKSIDRAVKENQGINEWAALETYEDLCSFYYKDLDKMDFTNDEANAARALKLKTKYSTLVKDLEDLKEKTKEWKQQSGMYFFSHQSNVTAAVNICNELKDL